MQATDSAGKCPTFNTEPNLDQARYIGKWYEHSKDIYNQFEWGAECGTAQYKTNAKTGFIDVRNRGWFCVSWNRSRRDQCSNQKQQGIEFKASFTTIKGIYNEFVRASLNSIR